MDKLELVAPAGNWDQLKGAVKAGADSIYLSYREYGARAYAQNFDFNDLKKASNFCLQKNVKIYLALNTIIKENEIHGLELFLTELNSKIQISGIIIQDISVLNLLKKIGCEKIPLHASTQMNVHNSQSAQFLKNIGFKRAVLARELTLKQIRQISSQEILDIEIFGHGSQCFSYSGQCYFSSFTGERSGNRGRCPQPCRMKYSLICSNNAANKKNDNQTKDSFFFSKNDLYTLNMIPNIADSKIKALKIEGRMKTPEYVSIVVSIYRKYIDLYYKDPSFYKVDQKDLSKLKQVFSRQLCDGYLKQSFPEEIINPIRSGSIGNLLGRIILIKIIDVKNKKFSLITVKSELNLHKNDVLEIWTKAGNEKHLIYDFKILKEDNTLKHTYEIILEQNTKAALNDRVFKKSDYMIEKEAKSFYGYDVFHVNNSPAKKDLKTVKSEKLEIKAENINFVNKKTTISILLKSFEKSEKSIEYFLATLRDIKEKYYRPAVRIHIDFLKEIKDKTKSLPYIVDSFLKLRDELKKSEIEISAYTPNIAYDLDMEEFKKIIEMLSAEGFGNYLISNIGFLNLIKKEADRNKDVKYNLALSYFLNISNSLSLFEIIRFLNLNNIKINEVIFSVEITAEEIKEVIENMLFEDSISSLSVYSFGYFPLMSARVDYEKFKAEKKAEIIGFKDQKGYIFTTRRDYLGNSVIYNSKKTCNIFDIDLLEQSHINSHFLDFTIVGLKEQQFIFKSYVEIMMLLSQKKHYIKKNKSKSISIINEKLSEYVKKIDNSEYISSYTKGHILRKVL